MLASHASYARFSLGYQTGRVTGVCFQVLEDFGAFKLKFLPLYKRVFTQVAISAQVPAGWVSVPSSTS